MDSDSCSGVRWEDVQSLIGGIALVCAFGFLGLAITIVVQFAVLYRIDKCVKMISKDVACSNTPLAT